MENKRGEDKRAIITANEGDLTDTAEPYGPIYIPKETVENSLLSETQLGLHDEVTTIKDNIDEEATGIKELEIVPQRTQTDLAVEAFNKNVEAIKNTYADLPDEATIKELKIKLKEGQLTAEESSILDRYNQREQLLKNERDTLRAALETDPYPLKYTDYMSNVDEIEYNNGSGTITYTNNAITTVNRLCRRI